MAADDATTVGEVAEAYVEAYAVLDPVAATRLGIVGHETEVTDFGPEGVAARAELAGRTLRAVLIARADADAARVAAAVMVAARRRLRRPRGGGVAA